jgi:hypothetical protein
MDQLLARVWLVVPVCLFIACGRPGPGGENGPSAGVLRKTLSIDLAQVSTLLTLKSTGTSTSPLEAAPTGSRRYARDTGDPAGGSTGPQLFAVSLSGELLQVSFVEPPAGQSGSPPEPQVRGILPTASWIVFSLFDFKVSVAGADGGYEEVQCPTLAARRVDGALFCAPLATNVEGDGPGDPFGQKVASSNAAGDVVYTTGWVPPSIRRVVYRLRLSQDGGPAAELAADPFLEPNRMLSNAAGDLYVNYTPSALRPEVTQSRIVSNDGSPFVLQSPINVFVATGKRGDPDENTFYVTHGGSGGINFDGSWSLVSKTGDTFAESTFTPNLANPQSYWFPFTLRDGLYALSMSEKAIARLTANGAVVPTPSPIPLTGVDTFPSLGGGPMRLAPGLLVLFASTGSGYKFLRHDGLTQQDIPLEANVEPSSFIVGSDGAIEFFGVRTTTREQLRGTVAAGSTQVGLTSATVDPAQVVVFTRIN